MAVSPRTVVLASASPRRKALLEAAAYAVEVRVPNADETWPEGELEEAVVALARLKLDAVGEADRPIIAADTVVRLDHERLGKPRDAAEATRMLRALSGREHLVTTGYCVRSGTRERAGAVTTHVVFRSLSLVEIERYIASGEPFDKAGSYAIQGLAGAFVDRISGSYTNVVGLPLAEVIDAVEALR